MKELREDKKYKYAQDSVLRQVASGEALQAFAKLNYKFFYPTMLSLQADKIIAQSYNDQIYDIDRLREKWGANFEGLSSVLPKEALGTHGIYSIDVNENDVITHRVVLDLNDNGVDEGDFVLASWTGNDRGGATGSQMNMTWDKQNGVTVNSIASSASKTQNQAKK